MSKRKAEPDDASVVYVVTTTRFRDDYKCRGSWSEIEGCVWCKSLQDALAVRRRIEEAFCREREQDLADQRDDGEASSDAPADETHEDRFERLASGEYVPVLMQVDVHRCVQAELTK